MSERGAPPASVRLAGMATSSTEARARGRRELTGAVLLAAAAGALGLVAGSRPWLELRVVREPPLPPITEVVTGATAAPLVPGLALVVLAAAAGLLATRRWGRLLVGLVIVAAGAAMVAAAAPWLGVVTAEQARELAFGVGLPAGSPQVTGGSGALVAVLAGGVAVFLGIATLLRSRRWPAMGARYDARAAEGGVDSEAVAPNPLPVSDQEAWDALDRGQDPTCADPTRRSTL